MTTAHPRRTPPQTTNHGANRRKSSPAGSGPAAGDGRLAGGITGVLGRSKTPIRGGGVASVGAGATPTIWPQAGQGTPGPMSGLLIWNCCPQAQVKTEDMKVLAQLEDRQSE